MVLMTIYSLVKENRELEGELIKSQGNSSLKVMFYLSQTTLHRARTLFVRTSMFYSSKFSEYGF